MFTPEKFADSCDQAVKDLAEIGAQLKRGDLDSVALGQTTLEGNLRLLRTRCVSYTIADPELEQLGSDLVEALEEQDRAEDAGPQEYQEAIQRAITKLAVKIAGHPVRTLEGLRVKARALQWVQRRITIEFDESPDLERLASELSSELADELLRLGSE